MKNSACYVLICVIVAASLIGCGGNGSGVKTGTVQGKVQFKGMPLTKGTVFFFAAKGGDAASGTIQADGTYTLRYEKGLSVPVGDYTVSVILDDAGGPIMDPMQLNEKIEKEGLPKPSEGIPVKYTDPKTSGLISVIKEGANTADFELK